MKRRILAVMMTMILSLFSVQMTALAENDEATDGKVYGDAIITASIENTDCQQLNELEAAQITAVIGLANRPDFTPLEIPVEAIAMDMEEGAESADLTFWLGYKEKAIEKAFLDYLSDIQGDVLGDFEDFEDFEEEFDEDIDMSEMEEDAEDAIDDASALLNEITIELKGLPEHYKVDMDMSSCAVVTSEIVKAIVEMIEELLSWLYPEINIEEDGFEGLIDAILAEEDTSLDELLAEVEAEDPELAAQVRVLFEEIDNTIAYMQSDEFPGLLFVGASLSCDCPEKAYYEILHEYYKNVNGELVYVDCVFEEFEDYEGKTVNANDFIKCEYNGVTYEYMGSYDLNVMFEEAYFGYDWSDFAMDGFVTGDENVWGLILRYEIVEDKDAGTQQGTESDDKNDKDDQGTANEDLDTSHAPAGRKPSPKTGDGQNIGLYLMMTVGALGVIVFKLRKMKA